MADYDPMHPVNEEYRQNEERKTMARRYAQMYLSGNELSVAKDALVDLTEYGAWVEAFVWVSRVDAEAHDHEGALSHLDGRDNRNLKAYCDEPVR